MTIRLKEGRADLGPLPGVTRVERQGREVMLWVRGELNPLLRAVVEADVEDVVFPEADLEGIFLGYYGNGRDRA